MQSELLKGTQLYHIIEPHNRNVIFSFKSNQRVAQTSGSSHICSFGLRKRASEDHLKNSYRHRKIARSSEHAN